MEAFASENNAQPKENVSSARKTNPWVESINAQTPVFLSQTFQRSYMPRFATSVEQAIDVSSSDWAFELLRFAMGSDAGFIRLYSDSTFRGDEYATRFETVDWVGAALNQVFRRAGQGRCGFRRPNRPFTPSSNISPNAFYYQSYLTIGRATGERLLYQPGSGSPERNGDLALTRRDAAVILNRYFFRPIEEFSRSASSTREAPFLASGQLSSHTSKSADEVGNLSSTSQWVNQSDTYVAQVVSVTEFSDLSPSDPGYRDIQALVDRWAVLQSYPDGTFRANQRITRAELASLLGASMDVALGLIDQSCDSGSTPQANAPQPILEVEGVLDSTSLRLASDNSRYTPYTFSGRAGQRVTITMESRDFDTHLTLLDSNDNVVGRNDDTGSTTNSALTVTLNSNGTYTIIANAYDSTGQGRFTLTVR